MFSKNGKRGYKLKLTHLYGPWIMHRSGFSNWKNVAGGNCKVDGALSHHDNGNIVKWVEHPFCREEWGASLRKF